MYRTISQCQEGVWNVALLRSEETGLSRLVVNASIGEDLVFLECAEVDHHINALLYGYIIYGPVIDGRRECMDIVYPSVIEQDFGGTSPLNNGAKILKGIEMAIEHYYKNRTKFREGIISLERRNRRAA